MLNYSIYAPNGFPEVQLLLRVIRAASIWIPQIKDCDLRHRNAQVTPSNPSSVVVVEGFEAKLQTQFDR